MAESYCIYVVLCLTIICFRLCLSETGGSDVNSASSTCQRNGQNSYQMARNIGSSVPTYSIGGCVIGRSIGCGASIQVFEGACIIGRTTTRVIAFKSLCEILPPKKSISLIWRESTGWLKSCLHIIDIYGLVLDRLTPGIIVELARYPLNNYLSNIGQRHCSVSLIEEVRLYCDIYAGLWALYNAEIL